MPCGGIYQTHRETLPGLRQWHDNCAHCTRYHDDKGLWPDLYVEEWDGMMVHRSCLVAYLKEDEGAIVRNHNHEVVVDAEVLFEEGKAWPDDWETIVTRAVERSIK